jgi:hypothetical protein
MADASMRAQVSARRHAEEVDDFKREMASWEARMKAKDADLRGNKVSKMDPVGKPKKVRLRRNATSIIFLSLRLLVH